MMRAITAYAMLNFLYFIAIASKSSGSAGVDGSAIRGFSGHWLVFYGAAFATLYSATRRADLLDGIEMSARTRG